MTITVLQQLAVVAAAVVVLAVLVIPAAVVAVRNRRVRHRIWRRYLAAHRSSSTAPRATATGCAAVDVMAPGPTRLPRASGPGASPLGVHTDTGVYCARGEDCPRVDHYEIGRAALDQGCPK